MRNAIVVAAFAASAFAVPHNHRHRRDEVIVTDYDIVTAVDIVTVTAGSPPPAETTTTVAPASSSSSSRRHHWHWSAWSSKETSTTEAPAPSSTPVSTSTYVAPSPSSYEAPSSSTEAPETTAAPSTTQAPSSVWTTSKPSTTQKPSSTAAATTSAANDGSYSAVAVAHHNLHRSNHSAPAIEWDNGLASTAQKIAESCVYAHNTDMDGGGYGQNIAAGVEPNNISAIITDLFYNGEVNWYDGLYGEANPDMTNFEHWGHFSQIVWVDTTHVGCYTQDCTANGLGNVGGDVAAYFTVCNYKSPGNYGGEYGTNVLKSNGDPTADWNTGSSVSS